MFDDMDNSELLAAFMHECSKDTQSEMSVNMSLELLRRLGSNHQIPRRIHGSCPPHVVPIGGEYCEDCGLHLGPSQLH